MADTLVQLIAAAGLYLAWDLGWSLVMDDDKPVNEVECRDCIVMCPACLWFHHQREQQRRLACMRRYRAACEVWSN